MTLAGIAFGANLDRPDRTFARTLPVLESTPGVRVSRRSGLWRSAPWGVADQPEYLNGVVIAEVELSPEALLARLHALEAEAGRRRAVRWGPRTLDLDLLFHGEERRDTASLRLPHPEMDRRTFVLRPLAEVAPDWRHPAHGRTADAMLAALEAAGEATPCERVEGAYVGDELPVAPGGRS